MYIGIYGKIKLTDQALVVPLKSIRYDWIVTDIKEK